MINIFLLAVIGALLLLEVMLLAEEECVKRQKAYEQRLHTRLVMFDAAGPGEDLACDIYRTNNVLGRRKRKSDISMACYDDNRISRTHAVLDYDGENFWMKPVYRYHSKCHTEVIVENEVVPPEGCIVTYGDHIAIAGHLMELQNTNSA